MSVQPIIKLGSKGPSVTLLQQRLVSKGFVVGVDGDFGRRTEAAVEQFQASSGLEADGVVGPLTWTLLMAEGTAETPKDVLTEQEQWLLAQVPAGIPSQVRAVLEVAIRRLGDREVPNGSNGGPEIADIVEWEGGDGKVPSAYYLHWGITDKAVLKSMPPWCALFACWALRKGLGSPSWEATPFGKWYGGVAQIEDWARKNKRWISPVPTSVEAGSLFTISRDGSGSDAASSAGAGHVGLVVRDNGDGTLTTIEGNVSNKVGSHKRKKSAIRGIIRWW